MEERNEFDLDLALQEFVDSLNPNELLSDVDKDELRDHVYLEMDSLKELGLSEEEAFIISQKRFGKSELIQEEYHKAKPEKRWFQFLFSAVMVVFGLKTIFNLMSITSLSTLVALKELFQINIGLYIKWIDLGIKIFTLLISLLAGGLIIRRAISGKIKFLWPIPTAFLISESIRVLLLSLYPSLLLKF